MSNRNYSQEELAAALASMGVTDQTDVSRYGSGHINDTFKVETTSGVRYILQRVNTDIFPPEMLKENVIRVTEHLKAKGIKSLEVVGYENPWRLYAFLEGYQSVDLVTNPAEAELYRELAWMFELKIGTDLDTAAPLYREKWKAIVEDVSKRGAWNELAMDERKMRRLEEKTGFSDWTDPQLSAIYWALEGVRRSKDVREKRALLQITKQAAVLYAKNRKNLIK